MVSSVHLTVRCYHKQVTLWMYVAEPLQHTDPIELFQWLPKEHMCILVYLVCLIS